MVTTLRRSSQGQGCLSYVINKTSIQNVRIKEEEQGQPQKQQRQNHSVVFPATTITTTTKTTPRNESVTLDGTTRMTNRPLANHLRLNDSHQTSMTETTRAATKKTCRIFFVDLSSEKEHDDDDDDNDNDDNDNDDDDSKFPAKKIHKSYKKRRRCRPLVPSKPGTTTNSIHPTADNTKHIKQQSKQQSQQQQQQQHGDDSNNTLEDWLRKTCPEEVERINQDFFEHVSNVIVPTELLPGSGKNEDNSNHNHNHNNNSNTATATMTTTPTALCQILRESCQRDHFDNETTTTKTSRLLSNISPEKLIQLNEIATRRALMGPVPVASPYTVEEFRSMMEKASPSTTTSTTASTHNSQKRHLHGGFNLEQLEASRAVRRANQTIARSDSTFQTRAQYGRTMTSCGEFLLGMIGKLTKDQVFCDIGHGIGNLPIQAAFTYGCESRGIEMVGDRHQIAEFLQEFVQTQHELKSQATGEIRYTGQVRLRHGNLEDRVHREFLTNGVDLLYCNNYNGVFHTRANERSVDWSLDDYIAGLFTQLKPGAKLVTLYELSRLPLPLQEANDVRSKNGLPPSEDASFYTLEMIADPGGEDKLSFTAKPFTFYIYTRVGSATFLCHERGCSHHSIPIVAFATTRTLAEERLVPVTACPTCGERRITRRRPKTTNSSVSLL